MNHIRLVNLIKTLVTEANTNRHHSMRYNYGRKKLAGSPMHVPNKTPQLAETIKKKLVKRGKTDTGESANLIDTEPQYNSQITAASEPKP